MSDPELAAMGQVKAALEHLEPSARFRVLRWIASKFELPLTEPNSKIEAIDQRAEQERKSQETKRFEASLASHIRSKCPDGSQIRRFLVTADWLHRRGLPLNPTAVAKALAENHQARLANPADCLNKNVAKGLCEKTKNGFFVTPKGLAELGYQ